MEIEETIEIHFLLVICSNSIKMNIMKKKKKKEKKKEKKYENKNKTNNKKMQTIVVIFVIK